MLVAGVDGYVDGWLVALVEAGDAPSIESIVAAASFNDVIGATAACDAIGVDIPIGLSDDGRRDADVQARKLLGGARASSVFPAPIRPVLQSESYREACRVSFAVSGRKLSQQTYHLLAKIREVDAAMTPDRQARIHEVHPEVCFRALNGATLTESKHTPAGLRSREDLLASVYGERLSARPLPRRATRDDLYDACAAAWTAIRIARGEAERVPLTPQRDTTGLRMEIVY